jgi:hypothetical protein
MPRVGRWLTAIVSLLLLIGSPGHAADPPSVPILLYHRLGPVSPEEMTVTTPVFEAQLRLIQERGYKVIPLTQLLAALGDTAVPMRNRLVRAAASTPSMCTEGQTLNVVKWCSASHTASKPPRSMISMRWSARA